MQTIDRKNATPPVSAAASSDAGGPTAHTKSALLVELTHKIRTAILAVTSPQFRPCALRAVLAKWFAQAASAPAMEKSECEDELEQVRDMFGDGFTELASLYQTHSSASIMKLRAAGNARDYAMVERIAHAFSGSSASIGAISLSALCKELERRAKTNALEDIEQRLAAIETEYGRICSRMQSLTKES